MDSRVIYVCPNYEEYKQDFKTKRIWRTDGKYEPFVYIIQEVETDMMYIGSKTQYAGKPCLESWLGSEYFTSSKEFDWESKPDSFVILDIIPCASNHDALILEEILIKKHNAVKSDNYYNKNCSGATWNLSGRVGPEHPAYGRKDSEETNRKRSLAKKGIPLWSINGGQSEEHRKKNSEANKGINNAMFGLLGENHPAFGYRHSEESIKRRLESRKGYKHSAETKEKIGNSSRGRKHSDETKRKMSKSSSGELNGMYNRSHSEEARQKISESAKNRKKKRCLYCNKEFSPGTYSRWHNEKCKHKK